MSVRVIGAGAFGTALAISLAGKERVQLWSRADIHVQDMVRHRENTARLPGVPFPEALRVTGDFDTIAGENTLLLAVPMQQLRSVLTQHREVLAGKSLVACCKGIELATGQGPIAVISEIFPNAHPALLTGPSFATDIARGLPTALTLACTDDGLGKALQQSLNTDNIRLYRTTDTIGAELGGALKNVMAIACGAVIGAGLGDSARAALMTRGYAEMLRMALAKGARAETLAGLSGFGDLALTCTSDMSRNYQLGLSIGRQEPFDPKVTVEGAATARAVIVECTRMGLDMPITQSVVDLIDQKTSITEAMAQLLARPLKEE
ncbi:MAG: glycerol-3-phosphate dehydrogenase [Rhodobacteraceae bacterium]|nr:MAG: glycerol-3-phosphate dehydrogenase [Paracoccaceae bacterium]